jgi:hypothetical protein
MRGQKMTHLTTHTEFHRVSRDPFPTSLLVCCLALILQPLHGLAQQNRDASTTSVQHTPAQQDGQHDLDFEVGTWKIDLKRLLHPLAGSTIWVEFDGTRKAQRP